MLHKSTLLLGAHMSIAGGYYKAIERGESIGCTAIQIFTKSNRRWNAKKITRDQANKFKVTWQHSSIRDIIAHASYLINIGSPNKETNKKSVIALTDELERCHQLGIPHLVLHPGSCLDAREQICLDTIVVNLDAVFSRTSNNTMILLETMAGPGSSIGHTFKQLSYLIKKSKHKKRLGICFDTCHTFVAGYDFSSKKKYNEMWEHFDKLIGLEKLKAIHVNNSKKAIGARVDRHADIGKGKIGTQAFKLLFEDKRFVDIPKILETPKETLKDDERNMAMIKKIIGK